MIKKLLGLFTKESVGVRSSNKPTPNRGKTPSANPYRAVAIVPGAHCCETAKLKRHSRMLMRNAPALPLGNCSMPQRCACHYARYEDRRESPRRSFGEDTQRVWYAGQERRTAKGRRAQD